MVATAVISNSLCNALLQGAQDRSVFLLPLCPLKMAFMRQQTTPSTLSPHPLANNLSPFGKKQPTNHVSGHHHL